jgi:hypothetical protein
MAVVFKVKLDRPCKLWTGYTNEDGYGCRWYQGGARGAHRVAYAQAHGLTMKDIEGVVIRHKCDTPACIEPTHLIPGTQQDNIRDMIQRGRRKQHYGPKSTTHIRRGEAHPQAKLTADQVRTIRQRLAHGQAPTLLAKEFKVGRSTIGRIKAATHWVYVV